MIVDPALIFRYPLLLFPVSLLVLWLAAWIAATRFERFRSQAAEEREDFAVIQGAILTLLGLIIGFTFSMALGRYDQRKNLEEEEANAIGTEYLRADLLPAVDAEKVRSLLLSYVDQRVLFYATRDDQQLERIAVVTAKLQADLWSVMKESAAAQPSPVVALVVSGMNDVLNSQGYTQAAWSNRIPLSAWALMVTIAVCATMLVSAGARSAKAHSRLLPVLPLVVSIAFLLIADIDSPRRGMIRVVPQNLESLSRSLHAH